MEQGGRVGRKLLGFFNKCLVVLYYICDLENVKRKQKKRRGGGAGEENNNVKR